MKENLTIAICGSTRFKQEMIDLGGILAITEAKILLPDMDHFIGDKNLNPKESINKKIIEKCDRLLVFNPDGYIDESTWYDICYAKTLGTQIETVQAIDPLLIDFIHRKQLSYARKLAKKNASPNNKSAYSKAKRTNFTSIQKARLVDELIAKYGSTSDWLYDENNFNSYLMEAIANNLATFANYAYCTCTTCEHVFATDIFTDTFNDDRNYLCPVCGMDSLVPGMLSMELLHRIKGFPYNL